MLDESKIIVGSYKAVEGYTEKTLLKSRVPCKLCGEIIQSKHNYDFVTWFFGFVSIDGGLIGPRCLGDESDIEYLYEFLNKC